MAQPGLALATRAPLRPVARAMASSLRSRMAPPAPGGPRSTRRRPRSTGPRRRARPRRRTCPSTVRTARWVRWTWRRWHGSCTMTGARRRRHRRQSVDPLGQPLVDVEDAGAEAPGRRPSRAGGRSPSGRAAAGRVDQDRRVAGHRRHHPRGQRAAPAGRGRRGRAARHSSRRPGPGGRHRAPVASSTWMVATCVGRCHASITQPVNSHTSVPLARSGGRRSGRRGRPRRWGTRWSRCATASALEPGQQQPVVAEGRGRRGAASGA